MKHNILFVISLCTMLQGSINALTGREVQHLREQREQIQKKIEQQHVPFATISSQDAWQKARDKERQLREQLKNIENKLGNYLLP